VCRTALLIARVAALGLSLDFDMYCLGAVEEKASTVDAAT